MLVLDVVVILLIANGGNLELSTVVGGAIKIWRTAGNGEGLIEATAVSPLGCRLSNKERAKGSHEMEGCLPEVKTVTIACSRVIKFHCVYPVSTAWYGFAGRQSLAVHIKKSKE